MNFKDIFKNTQKINMKFFNIFLIFLSINIFAQQDLLVDKIVAIVGEEVVLHSDIEVNYGQYISQGAPEGNETKCQILDELMLEKLLLTHARLDSVVVSEAEVEAELDNRFRYYVSLLGSEEAFEEYFKKSVLEFKEDFREDLYDQLLAQRKQSEIIANVKVTPAEVKEYFNAIPQDSLPYFNSEVQLSQILIKPKVNEKERNKAIARAEDLRKRIVEGGEDFATLATTYSDDPGSGKQGGDLGFMNRGDLVKEYEAVAFKLEKNEVSELVESQFGFHIIQLLERRGNRIHTRHILIKPQITTADETLVQSQLDSIRIAIVNEELNFKDAVAEFSEDEQSKSINGMIQNPNSGSTYFQTDELEPDVYFAIESLNGEGEVTEPVIQRFPDGTTAYRIVQLVSKTPPHQANLKDDYGKLVNYALVSKQNEAINKWVYSRIKRTFVKLPNTSYLECPVMEKWER